MEADGGGILSGARVLDFGRFIAGPYCASMLAALGADVVRVERGEGGEDRYVLPIGATGDGTVFLQANRGKRSIALDMGSADSRHILERLVKRSDIVVANMPPAALRSLGLDYASLCRLKPDIILTAVGAFGSHGPSADRSGFDGVGQCIAGAAFLSGFPGQPLKAAVPYIDIATAAFAAFATLAAFVQRAQTGRGQEVSGSLIATAAAISNAYVLEEAATGANRQPHGNRSHLSGPSDLFATKDGWIVVQVLGDALFRRWARLMEDPEVWLNDPRFADDSRRAENGAALSERMGAWCAQRTTKEALDALAAARVPAGPVNTLAGALTDPDLAAGGAYEMLEYPGLPAAVPIARLLPVHPQGLTALGRPPLCGEHSAEILSELGYNSSEIAALRDRGVVASPRMEILP